MDANGARFWMLAKARDWVPADDPDCVQWDAARSMLRLASQRPEASYDEDFRLASRLRDEPPRAFDRNGGLATVIHGAGGDVARVSQTDWPDADLLSVSAARRRAGITGLCVSDDGYISAVVGGLLRVRDSRTQGDPREDWRELDPARFGLGTFEAWRVAPRPGGGAWVLDRANRKVARWTGTLLRARTIVPPAPGIFRPDPEDPETITYQVRIQDALDDDEPVALATSPGGRLAVLCWHRGARGALDARVFVFDDAGAPTFKASLTGLRYPYSLAFTDEGHIAVLATDTPDGGDPAPMAEALVFPLDGEGDTALLPTGDIYPLRRHTGDALILSEDGLCRYPSTDGARRLVALSLPQRPSLGNARAAAPFDCGVAGSCWHRLFIEAIVPEGCGLRVWLAATDSPAVPDEGWFPHDLGAVAEDPDPRVPRAAWLSATSEVPGHPGLLPCEITKNLAGLWTVLIQRAGKQTNRLLGRYLHVRVRLYGNGRNTPELAALRAYAPRFSYVREYLPELYHEDPALEASDEDGPASPADFLERFVSLFESGLTPLEDYVAETWNMAHPRTAPAESLDWLASWMGRTLDTALSEAVRRRMIEGAAVLSAWRGTLRGLQMALELVTTGGVTRGDLVVLEAWRLRRTWATILGANLTDEEHPLLGGLSISGNSLVGDTLILGDEHHREFLAVFGASAAKTQADKAAVAHFFEDSAWRVSVLATGDLDAEQVGNIRRIIAAEVPAHVTVDLRFASRNFIAGISALVGVDTHLGAPPPIRTVRLGRTRLGSGDRVRRPPGLHPDLEGEGG